MNLNHVTRIMDGLRHEFDEKLSCVRELTKEKFDAIQTQLQERNIRNEQRMAQAVSERNVMIRLVETTSNIQDEAMKAALIEIKHSFSKELDALRLLITSTKDYASTIREDMNARMGALGSRIDRGEGGGLATREARAETHANVNNLVAIISLGVAAIAVVINFMGHPQQQPTGLSANPTIGADTKRVDDLITLDNERNREISNRLDLLASRLNALSGPPQLPPPIQKQGPP